MLRPSLAGMALADLFEFAAFNHILGEERSIRERLGKNERLYGESVGKVRWTDKSSAAVAITQQDVVRKH